MSDAGPPDLETLLRQAQQHLQSLRSAGVEWLPAAPPAPATAAPPVSLFEPAAPPTSDPPSDGLTLEQRRHSLSVLAQEVARCQRCPQLVASRTQTVFGEGVPDVELCFIGEAPGGEEDAQGLPFVGPAGQLLNRIIAACGLKREEVYICNAIKCRPPGNRTPQAQEVANCHGYLERQLELVRPRFICCLGSVAAQALLNTNQPLGRLRRQFHDYRGTPVLCTYHPAYLLPHRNPEKKRDVWEDMKLLLARMGRAIPPTAKR
jgi:uracil-DNA glycosylase family 4